MNLSAVSENIRENDNDNARLPFLSFASVVVQIKSNEKERENGRDEGIELFYHRKLELRYNYINNVTLYVQSEKDFILA